MPRTRTDQPGVDQRVHRLLRPLGRALDDRSLLAALVTGAVLRTIWALQASTPSPRLSDPWRYQQMAVELARGSTPTIAGEPTALFPIGYPLLLAPLAWLVEQTGIGTLRGAAALLNLVASVATIALGAAVARRWFDDRTGRLAAWLLALAVPHILWTPVPFTESVFGAVLLWGLLLAVTAEDDGWRTRHLVALGALAGAAILIRSPGAVLLLAPAMAHRGRGGRWREALRPSLVVAATAAAVLLPWTARNVVQVGVATPLSTNNAAFVCLGNRPGGEGIPTESRAESERCWQGSPLDHAELYEPGDVPDGWVHRPLPESTWYRETTAEALRWMLAHPGEQPRLVVRRLTVTFGSSSTSLTDAEGFGTSELVAAPWRHLLVSAATGWTMLVLLASISGLALVRECRRAVLLWGTAVALLLPVVSGIGLQRYQHPVTLVLAVLGARSVVALSEVRRGARPAT